MATPFEDVKITGAENCENSPKIELLRDLNIAYVKKDIDFCMKWVTDDVIWEIIGDKRIQGIEKFEEALKQIKNYKVRELRIENVITHGNTGALNGTITLDDKQRFSFCEVYNFKGHSKNSKIKGITSYIIQTPQENHS